MAAGKRAQAATEIESDIPGEKPEIPGTRESPPGGGAPNLVTVLVGGRSYQVPQEVAQSIAEEQQSFYRERGRLSGELAELRTRGSEDRPTTVESSGPEKPPARLATEDYEEYERRMEAYRLHRELELERRIEEKTAKRNAEREKAAHDRAQLEIFIGRVGKEHHALDGEEDIILKAMGRVARRHPGDPLLYSDPRTLKLVSEEAAAELTRLAEKGKSLAPGVPQIEGQGGRGGTSAGEGTQERQKATEPISIADIQRMKREKRRAAAGGGRLGREED